MATVTILAVLASVAVPKYAGILQKSEEGSLKGNLGTMRSALSIYYADNQGFYPVCSGPNSPDFALGMTPKYVQSVPSVVSGLHPPTNAVYCDYAMVGGSVHDGQGWYYDGELPADSQVGTIAVACDHNDTTGNSWTSY